MKQFFAVKNELVSRFRFSSKFLSTFSKICWIVSTNVNNIEHIQALETFRLQMKPLVARKTAHYVIKSEFENHAFSIFACICATLIFDIEFQKFI